MYSKIVKFESCPENIQVKSSTHSKKCVGVLFTLVTLYQGLQNAWKQYPVIFLFSCSRRDFNNCGYLPFTWKIRLENELVSIILFGKPRKYMGFDLMRITISAPCILFSSLRAVVFPGLT